MDTERRIGILVFDGVKLLDVAGPGEVFAEANRFGAHYRLVMCSPEGQDVSTSTGLRISVDTAAAETGRLDVAMVAGGDALPTHPIDPRLVSAAATLHRHARETASICTGAFILAAAGLLDGRRATTHWKHAATLARAHPAVRVDPDAIHVTDGPILTCAGVTAGIDLSLALVERDHGPELAREVARSLVVFLQRPGGQSQFSPAMRSPLPRTAPLHQLCAAITAQPAGDYSVTALAALAHLSARQLTRLFRDELGTSPAKYVEQIRVDTAKDLLDSGHSVTAAAQDSGFGSPETLRRVFLQHFGVSPRAYQRRFHSALRE
ncbi:GlxA family transcriptional regulator [Nocardia sp. NPDC052254]|uniref:GlxA family transcriptional regulator n=1 Tax=Nocardia sp. NPDC052254 TaxID=3155681 RepID=UPI0034296BCC